jgi:hypothetical protein
MEADFFCFGTILSLLEQRILRLHYTDMNINATQTPEVSANTETDRRNNSAVFSPLCLNYLKDL